MAAAARMWCHRVIDRRGQCGAGVRTTSGPRGADEVSAAIATLLGSQCSGKYQAISTQVRRFI
ncbi:PE family protein [Mycobacterium tuberculosis]|uniref:PE family protein n=1 Tax=Mycobacterium tuberculosis TaxID=1773 RepID=UPI003D7C6393